MEDPQPQINLQTPVQIPDFQPKPNYLKTIIFSVLLIATLSLIIYLVFQNQKLQKQITNQQITPTVEAPSPTPKPSSSISIPPDETAGWKTYNSNNLSLSFKYPPKYKPPEENNDYISLISPLNPEPQKGYELQNGELKVEIYISDARPNETLVDLIKKKKEQSNSIGSNVKILKEEEILINGIKAVKQTWEGMGTGQTILLVNSNKEFGIIKYPAVTTRDNEFDQILSTFRFASEN